MIKLRLQRKGRKRRPFYHVVVADSRSPRDGRIIEQVGRFDNVSESKELTLNEERIIHWLKTGAQPSDTVRSLLKKSGILYKMHLIRWGKSEEEIEAALIEWRKNREDKDSEKEISRKAQQKELLAREEKEYKKQLQEKSAAAAKELEKEKAETAAAETAEEETEAETAEAETTEEAATEEASAETAEEEVKAEETEEAPAKAEEEKAEVVEEPVAEEVVEEAAEEPVAEEVAEEAAEPAAEVKEEKAAEATQTSADMTANDAIDHIKNTDLKALKGFVAEGEERVTVLRAWESKQAE